ncbi:AAA family ATPase [Streptomyces sp. NPDC088387]|uniref:AAA family ATPase n=1 Tax=Streptomyces sp. NPDC088387 TaxID=3365859 RepID=UPI00380044B6
MAGRSEPKPGATAEEGPGSRTQAGLVDRDDVLREVTHAVTGPTGPAVLLVRGETGAGHSTVLATVTERLRAAGTPVCRVDCLPGDDQPPQLLAYRLLSALAKLPGPARDTGPAVEARFSAASVPAALGRALRDHPSLVVVIDDLRYADAESVQFLLSWVPALTRPSARLVLGVHVLADGTWLGGAGPAARAAASGRSLMVGVVDLPPLDKPGVGRLLARRLGAPPDEDLVEEVHRLSRGNPAAATAAVTGWEETGGIRLLFGRAHRIARAPVPVLPDDDRFVRGLRELGESPWRVAKALGIVEPVGARVPEVLAGATGMPENEVRAALAELVASGAVDRLTGPHPAAGPQGWAFRIPLVASAARARLGPYERRQISAAVVRRLWALRDGTAAGAGGVAPRSTVARAGGVPGVVAGEALAADADEADACLADRIADAGALVDPERAVRELPVIAERLWFTHSGRASRWLRAAADLMADPADRARALARYTSMALVAGEDRAAFEAADEILRVHVRELDAGTRQEVAVARVAALASAGDMVRLDAVADEYLPRVHEPDGVAAVAGALALCLLGRWTEGRSLLADAVLGRELGPVARYFGSVFDSAAQLMAGDSGALHRALALRPGEEIATHFAYALSLQQCEYLLALGELRLAVDVMKERGLTMEQFPARDRVLAQFLNGSWQDGMVSARSLLLNSLATARPPISVLAHARVATMLRARGWPLRARAVLDAARASAAPMPHLLDAEEASVHQFLGDTRLAARTLRRGVADAAEQGNVFGTEHMWAALASVEAERRSPDGAAESLTELRRTAATLGTESARLLFLRTSLTVAASGVGPLPGVRVTPAETAEALSLARAVGQPFDTARTLLAVSSAAPSAGPDTNRLLTEAYDLFGQLDALVWRFRTRTAMRRSGAPVPGRRRATEENERLLASLVTEGLTNRQIAAALALSEVGVEGRLNRLFARTGLRSRVELATAVLAGAYP